MKQLSEKLGECFGEGWSVDTLERCRKFYMLYSPLAISASPLRKLDSVSDVAEIRNSVAEIQTASAEPHKFVLSWSHYLILMRIKDANIYATEYALYLPDKKELQDILQQWIQEFDEEDR